ncbi:MAG: hypothetical protein KGI08_09645, partial [Thaumarchaeota archaeon]|nr:hypothetical protein [Nitrososphaerota archaeon]
AGVFNKVLQAPINRRSLFGGAATLATTISNASKLASMMEKIAPPAPALPVGPSAAETALSKISSLQDTFKVRSDQLMNDYYRAKHAVKATREAEQKALNESWPDRSLSWAEQDQWRAQNQAIDKKYEPELNKLQSEMIQNHHALRDEAQKELASHREALNLPDLNPEQQFVANYVIDRWPGLGGEFTDARIRQNPYYLNTERERFNDPRAMEYYDKNYQEAKKTNNFTDVDVGYLLHRMSPEEKAQIAEHIKPAMLQDPNLRLADARTIAKAFPSLKGFALFSDSSKPGAALAGLAKTSKPFYSAVESTIESAPQSKMHGVQWANWLKNQPGVKPEELEHTGLDNWLRDQKGPITKDQVRDFFNQNKVEVNDVVKGGAGQNKAWDELSPQERDRWLNSFADETGTDRDLLSWDDPDLHEYYNDMQHEGKGPSTKYSSYQLPGGENYREHLLILPPKNLPKNLPTSEQTVARMNELAQERFGMPYNDVPDNAPNGGRGAIIQRVREEQQAANNGYTTIGNSTLPKDVYKSSHWDEPNILAHVRSNERDVGGVPSLHLEELQSDWHQAGRKNGYEVKDNSQKIKEIENRLSDLLYEQGQIQSLPEGYKVVKDPSGGFMAQDETGFNTAWGQTEPEAASRAVQGLNSYQG